MKPPTDMMVPVEGAKGWTFCEWKQKIWKYSLPEMRIDPLFNEHWVSVTEPQTLPIKPPQSDWSPLQITIGAEASFWKPKLWHCVNELPWESPIIPPAEFKILMKKLSFSGKGKQVIQKWTNPFTRRSLTVQLINLSPPDVPIKPPVITFWKQIF